MSEALLERDVLEAPSITLLGSIDDERGTEGIGLSAEAPSPILAIIYNGI